MNVHFETQRFSLTIRHPGRTLVDDEFAVPGSTGVIFEDIGEIGYEYSIVAAVSDRPEVSTTWRVTACEGTEAPSGNSDGGVELEGETLEFRQNQCDVVTIGTRKIPYGEPDDYRA